MRKNLKETYRPLYFLASLGAGGIGVSFFMYLMFLVPHPDFGMPTFEHIFPLITGENLLISLLIGAVLLVIVFFLSLHYRLLIWNIREFKQFKKTESFTQLKNSNVQSTMMAIPLTLAMSINGLFILGIVFVPNLRNVIEYLFPLAVLAFLAVGILAINYFVSFFARILVDGNFKWENNNHLSQLISPFAFAMVAVGLAAPAAMSENLYTSSIATVLSLFFLAFAITLAFLFIILGVYSMIQFKLEKEMAPSLWIMIPFLTLVGITFVRLYNGVNHHFFHTAPNPWIIFLVLGFLVSLQIIFGIIGFVMMRKVNYFKEYLYGEKKSIASFTIICPAVAFMVLGMFFVGWGLVQTGLVEKYSIIHYLIMVPFILSQLKAIQWLFILRKKLF